MYIVQNRVKYGNGVNYLVLYRLVPSALSHTDPMLNYADLHTPILRWTMADYVKIIYYLRIHCFRHKHNEDT